MPTFSQRSLARLETCHPDLQTLFKRVIQFRDCTILEGFRDEASQNKAFAEGKSKLKWPNGKHNKSPSEAVDVMPFPIVWTDLSRIYHFSGFVLGVADMLLESGQMSHKIRWGGDWNSNHNLKDEVFKDLPHFEIVK